MFPPPLVHSKLVLLLVVSSLTGCDAEPSVMQQAAEHGSEKQLSADTYYKYEELHSRPSITPDSEIPENLLHLSYPSEKMSFLHKHLIRESDLNPSPVLPSVTPLAMTAGAEGTCSCWTTEL